MAPRAQRRRLPQRPVANSCIDLARAGVIVGSRSRRRHVPLETCRSILPRSPLGEAVQLEQTFDDAFLSANVDRFIERVTVSNLRNAPLDGEALRERFDREVAARGIAREDRDAWGNAWRRCGTGSGAILPSSPLRPTRST